MRKLLLIATLLLTACGSAPAGRSTGADLAAIPQDWPHAVPAAAVEAASAMVVSDAPLATDVGVQVMRDGGNAVDAAIATAFALAVVYPEAGNVGGGGFMIARMADGTIAALDFREKAPLAATRDMFLDERGELSRLSTHGHLASGVPGAVMGLWEAHRRFGTRPWADLIAPAVRLAEDGFIVDRELAASVRGAADRLRDFDASADLFLPRRHAHRRGQPLEQPRPGPRAAPRGRTRTRRLLRGRDRRPDRRGDAPRRRHHHARGPAPLPGGVARASPVQLPRPSRHLDAARIVRRHHARHHGERAGRLPLDRLGWHSQARSTSPPRPCAAPSPTAITSSAIPRSCSSRRTC
jgi:hypothetical protein